MHVLCFINLKTVHKYVISTQTCSFIIYLWISEMYLMLTHVNESKNMSLPTTLNFSWVFLLLTKYCIEFTIVTVCLIISLRMLYC